MERRSRTTNPAHHPRLPRIALAVVVLATVGLLAHKMTVHASANFPMVHSGVDGYCLDLHNSKIVPGNAVDAWECNNTRAQDWTTTFDTIRYGDNFCLSTDNSTNPGSPIVIEPCSDSPGQIWLRDKQGYLNPQSELCLSLPGGETDKQLILGDCSDITSNAERWEPTVATPGCSGSKGVLVACYAVHEWTTWQSGTPNHETLLTAYTDGAPYEEWCADFISYVYKEAGYPFTGGEADGWNENLADNIQNMGFTKQDPATYTPKPGDVAYFNYPGGHVEVVVGGGKTPTFIYGNSAATDPTTHNGQMAANTRLSENNLGNLTYYLSPNN